MSKWRILSCLTAWILCNHQMIWILIKYDVLNTAKILKVFARRRSKCSASTVSSQVHTRTTKSVLLQLRQNRNVIYWLLNLSNPRFCRHKCPNLNKRIFRTKKKLNMKVRTKFLRYRQFIVKSDKLLKIRKRRLLLILRANWPKRQNTWVVSRKSIKSISTISTPSIKVGINLDRKMTSNCFRLSKNDTQKLNRPFKKQNPRRLIKCFRKSKENRSTPNCPNTSSHKWTRFIIKVHSQVRVLEYQSNIRRRTILPQTKINPRILPKRTVRMLTRYLCLQTTFISKIYRNRKLLLPAKRVSKSHCTKDLSRVDQTN